LEESSLERSIQEAARLPVGEEPQGGKPASEKVALTAGGIAALLAGACCVAPLVLVSVGLGGAWLASLQLLAPYRPAFIAVALAALAFAGWRIYRPTAECAPGEACAVPGFKRGYKVGFWIVAGLFAVMVGFPYAAPLFY
jgi:mercuric ion transport protein